MKIMMTADPISWEPGLTLKTEQPYVVGALTLYLEKLAGSLRTGIDADGIPWESTLPAHYGHIIDTTGGDGEELDIYLNATNCDWAAAVHVIDQLNLSTQIWDEHKIMLGFASAQDAEATYIKAFSDNKGSDRLSATTTLDTDTFLIWVYTGETQSAIATQDIPGMVVRAGKLQISTLTTTPVLVVPTSRFGAVPVHLHPSTAVTLIDQCVGEKLCYSVYILGAISGAAKDRIIYNDIVRLLKTLPEQAVVSFYISSPGGDLMEATRLASAMRTTKANTTTHAIGPVCSAAVCIWAEGRVRHISPYAHFMQHMSIHGDFGKSTDIAARAMTIIHYVRTIVLQRQIEIGLWTEDEVADLVDKAVDLYITADEAMSRMEH